MQDRLSSHRKESLSLFLFRQTDTDLPAMVLTHLLPTQQAANQRSSHPSLRLDVGAEVGRYADMTDTHTHSLTHVIRTTFPFRALVRCTEYSVGLGRRYRVVNLLTFSLILLCALFVRCF
ncbi:hypothetical protein BJX68DRAFT_60135 [Aspergillus pseudodeflectus]|uniref:Uncharacterized protein n=1 Tax=Aspergillus pseudodeflectus TaxID=176178 RepID=A0ABR4KIQ1_9EURO